jgi:hypothetical protein
MERFLNSARQSQTGTQIGGLAIAGPLTGGVDFADVGGEF